MTALYLSFLEEPFLGGIIALPLQKAKVSPADKNSWPLRKGTHSKALGLGLCPHPSERRHGSLLQIWVAEGTQKGAFQGRF